MTQLATEELGREAFLSRLEEAGRLAGLPERREMIRRLLDRGARPIDPDVISMLARAHQRPPAIAAAPAAASDGWPGSAFVDPPPGFKNRPAPDGPPTVSPAGRKVTPCADDALRRLVDRTTFGFSWEELDYAYTNGYEAYLEWQLDYESIDDSELDARLTEFVTLNESPRELVIRAYVNGDYSMAWELLFATILRQTTSKRQLYERVVEFWSDHFNIYLFKDATQVLKAVDDREVIRRHALGKFSDLLEASAKSPAMLIYLDNASNYAWAPNQNYARELLELHTVGVDNFSQQDMLEVARCFTGWTIDADFESPTLGEYRFEQYWHDYGLKKVLGRKIMPGGGERDGEQVIDILCHGRRGAPLTARFLARKLAVRFWGENPPEALVEQTAQAYLDTGGEIKAMLRVVLSERWLRCSQPRLKRPVHLAVSMMRAIPSYMFAFWAPLYLMDAMGQVPFFWAPPNGYPEAAAYWAGHILPRWRYGFSMLQEQGDVGFNYAPFNKDTPEEVVDQIDLYLFAGAMPAEDRDSLLAYLGQPPIPFQRILEAVGLAIASPAFQEY